MLSDVGKGNWPVEERNKFSVLSMWLEVGHLGCALVNWVRLDGGSLLWIIPLEQQVGLGCWGYWIDNSLISNEFVFLFISIQFNQLAKQQWMHKPSLYMHVDAMLSTYKSYSLKFSLKTRIFPDAMLSTSKAPVRVCSLQFAFLRWWMMTKIYQPSFEF